MPRQSDVRIDIINLAGRIIKSFEFEQKPAGEYNIVWDGRTDQGDIAASGVYIYKMNTARYRATRKLVLLK